MIKEAKLTQSLLVQMFLSYHFRKGDESYAIGRQMREKGKCTPTLALLALHHIQYEEWRQINVPKFYIKSLACGKETIIIFSIWIGYNLSH